MRKTVLPVLALLIAAAPAAAFAAGTAPATASAADQTIAGTVKFFSTSARSLELADGSWYYLPTDYKAPDLKAGDKVTVHWKMNGSAHDVTMIDVG